MEGISTPKSFVLVLWDNGVRSVHFTRDEAESHIKRLRGQEDSWALGNRSPERKAKWLNAHAHIIEVSTTKVEGPV